MSAPFSRRVARGQAWIVNDWPNSARVALIHLLHDLVDREYVIGWKAIDKELRRVARQVPANYEGVPIEVITDSVWASLSNMQWERVFDFCERLYGHLACGVSGWNDFYQREVETESREEVQLHIEAELTRIFEEEHFGYEFTQGVVRRRGRSHSRDQVAKVEPTLGDPRLNSARTHYKKALEYFENRSRPDYENTVKEAVCAVEAAAKSLFPELNAKTLGEVLKRIEGLGVGQVPKPLAVTLSGVYGFRNAGEGVSHGGADGGKVTPAIAEYILAIAASQIIFLYEVARSADKDVPF